MAFMSEFNDDVLVVPASVIVFPLLVISKTLGSLSSLHFSLVFSLHQGFRLAVTVCAATVWGLATGSMRAQLWVLLSIGMIPSLVLVTSLPGYLGTMWRFSSSV